MCKLWYGLGRDKTRRTEYCKHTHMFVVFFFVYFFDCIVMDAIQLNGFQAIKAALCLLVVIVVSVETNQRSKYEPVVFLTQ